VAKVASSQRLTKGAEGEKRPRGRPSDQELSKNSLYAAYQEFIARGYLGLSMDSIAVSAGVSKVSLYRRWANKAEVMADVFRFMGQEEVPNLAGNLKQQLHTLIHGALLGAGAGQRGQVVMRTIGEIATNPELVTLYRDHILYPRMNQIRTYLENARSRGEISETVSIEVACALVGGPLLLSQLALTADMDIGMSEEFVNSLVEMVSSGLGIS
jgi:AcrR family transcriptional regulator